MIYQEKYEITDRNITYFSKQFDILITGYCEETNDRHAHFKESLKDYRGEVYSFDTCENAEEFHYKIENYSGELLEQATKKSLIPDLQKLLRRDHFEGANLCIDITSIKHGILFLLIKLFITEIKPARLFAAYTEPKEYRKRDYIVVGETEEYDLYERIIGSSNGIPGFIKTRSSKDILLLATLGFDCQRLQTIYENLKPKKIIPVVGFPSFVPGWDLTAIKMNYMILKGAECVEMLKTCEASSPFKMYKMLKDEFDRYNSNYDLYVAPLGTRPHCLGAAIFVSKYPSTFLVYDFPVEKQFRSNKVLKCSIYHLSKYIE